MVANVTAFTSGRDLASVSENVELLTGQRGNKLDRPSPIVIWNRLA